MKQLLLTLFSGLTFFAAAAQKGSTQVGIAAEVGLPVGIFGGSEGFKAGFGGSVKGLFGISESGQITATTGYTTYTANGSTNTEKVTLSIIPILIGYRHSISGFYLEPQLGVGIYGAKVTYSGQSQSGSTNRFTWAAGIGYAKNSIDLGVRYQSGVIADGDISLIGFRLGYNFSVGRSK